MSKRQLEPVSNDEPIPLPWDTGGESAEEAGQDLFEEMEELGVDYDDLDHPDEANEPTPADRKRRKRQSREDEEDEFEDDDELEDEESVEDDFDDEDEFEGEDEFEDEFEDETDRDSDEELFEVTLPGGEKAKVTREELTAGYSRTADYTRKRQRDAAEHHKAMESLREKREIYGAKLERLQKALEEIGPKEPDPKLLETNPGLYAAQQVAYDKHQRQLEAIEFERETVTGEVDEETAEAQRAFIEHEQMQLFDAVPEWKKSPRKAAEDLQGLAEFIISDYGYTPDEVQQLVDHRAILIIRDLKAAMDRLSRGKSRLKKRRGAKRMRPGSSRKSRVERRQGRGGRSSEARRLRKQIERGGGTLRDHARLLDLESGDDL